MLVRCRFQGACPENDRHSLQRSLSRHARQKAKGTLSGPPSVSPCIDPTRAHERQNRGPLFETTFIPAVLS